MDIARLRYFREQLALVTARLPFDTEKKDIHTLMRDLDELIQTELAAPSVDEPGIAIGKGADLTAGEGAKP